MEFFFDLLTPCIYNKDDGESNFDEISEHFAKGLKNKIINEWNSTCKYEKNVNADVDSFDIFEEKYLKDSENVLIIASPKSKHVLESFLKKLLSWLNERDDLIRRFFFIYLEGLKVNVGFKYWKLEGEDIFKSLFNLIQPKAVSALTERTNEIKVSSEIKDSGDIVQDKSSIISIVENVVDFANLLSYLESIFPIPIIRSMRPLLSLISRLTGKYFPKEKKGKEKGAASESDGNLSELFMSMPLAVVYFTVLQKRYLLILLPATTLVMYLYGNTRMKDILLSNFTRILRISDNNQKIESEDDSQNIPGKPRGLRNTKETCYMNSMIQALSSSSRLIENLNVTMRNHTPNEKFKLFLETLKIVNTPTDDDSDDEATDKLLSFMKTAQWNRASQQDAFQLLSFFINFIQKDVGIKKISMPPKFKILHAFSEDSKYNKVQGHLALALPLCGTYKELPGESLECLMDEFFKPSIIDEGPNNTQLYVFEEAPEVMIIHIQANEWDDDLGAFVKPKYYIKYEEELKYTFTIKKKVDGSEEDHNEVSYQLRAVVHHMGSISGGHYITYRRYSSRWYLTNDTQVEEVSFKCDVVPYIMVYEKLK